MVVKGSQRDGSAICEDFFDFGKIDIIYTFVHLQRGTRGARLTLIGKSQI